MGKTSRTSAFKKKVPLEVLREDFDKVLARARTAAKKAGLKKEMIAEEIKKYRKERKRRKETHLNQ